MKEHKQGLANHEMEIAIGNILRLGVITAAAVVFLGGIIYISRHGLDPVNYKVFQRLSFDLCNIRGILKNALAFNGRGLIQLGVLLLIATPVARVAFSILGFALKRDTLYVIVTLIVFSILIYSLLGS